MLYICAYESQHCIESEGSNPFLPMESLREKKNLITGQNARVFKAVKLGNDSGEAFGRMTRTQKALKKITLFCHTACAV